MNLTSLASILVIKYLVSVTVFSLELIYVLLATPIDFNPSHLSLFVNHLISFVKIYSLFSELPCAFSLTQ